MSFNADIIHVHYGASQALATVLFAPKPVIISFCGSDLLGNYDASGRKTWSGRLSMVLSQMAVLGCRNSIGKTAELKEALWFSWLRRHCRVIPNGVDLTQFRPLSQAEARASLVWRHDDPVVLFVDRWKDWVKDPDLARAAYERARTAVPTAQWVVVHNEPSERMQLFYNAADALLLTSRHEGSNNAVKEALACGLPVVATSCGDIPERLHGVRACFSCERDPEELGHRLAHVLRLRERTNGHEHAQELALDRVAVRIKQCYEEALRIPSRRWSWMAWRQRMSHTTRRDII